MFFMLKFKKGRFFIYTYLLKKLKYDCKTKTLKFVCEGEEAEGDVEIAEIVAQQTLAAHGSLLSKGLALSNPPSVTQALDGVLPFR